MTTSGKDVSNNTSPLPKISYSYNAWQRLRTVCKVLRQTEEKVTKLKEEIEEKLQATAATRKKKSDVQFCEILLHSLRGQLEFRQAHVRTLGAKLASFRVRMESNVNSLDVFREQVRCKKRELADCKRLHIASREQLVRGSAQLLMRRKQMIQDLRFIYPIDVFNSTACMVKGASCNPVYKICLAHLPDAEFYLGHDDSAVAVALGYVAHLVHVLARILDVPLRYHMILFGSRSAVEDQCFECLPDTDRVFPLFAKGQDKERYHYGVFLVNKNIAQVRCYCGLFTQDLRCTLQNLSDLIAVNTGDRVDSQLMLPRPLTFTSTASHSASSIPNRLMRQSRDTLSSVASSRSAFSDPHSPRRSFLDVSGFSPPSSMPNEKAGSSNSENSRGTPTISSGDLDVSDRRIDGYYVSEDFTDHSGSAEYQTDKSHPPLEGVIFNDFKEIEAATEALFLENY